MKSKKIITISLISLSACLVASLTGLIVTGATIGWGPFSFIYWPREVRRVLKENPVEEYKNNIVFYGASNFRLWKEMKQDLKPYKVANNGFGGSTDKLLLEKADTLLYPYNPKVLFLQTGSNDYPGAKGSNEEIANNVLEVKKNMYTTFHNKLPDTKIYVMAGILMPGRSSFTPIVKLVNQGLRDYCSNIDYLTFVDSESLTYQNNDYVYDYFIKDGIHLTHEARLKWASDYILPELNKLNLD